MTTPLPAEAVALAADAITETLFTEIGITLDNFPAMRTANAALHAARPSIEQAASAVPHPVIDVQGELTEQQAAELRAKIQAAIASGKPDVLRDGPVVTPIDKLIADAVTAERLRITQLEQLAADILSHFHPAGDGHRARAGQIQIAKWQATLAGEQ